MQYNIKTDADGRIVVSLEGNAAIEGFLTVEMPEDFCQEAQHNWRYLDGQAVYDPLPQEDAPKEKTDAERIAELEAKITAMESDNLVTLMALAELYEGM